MIANQKPWLLLLTWWCIKLWDIMSLGSVQVVGFFDVAACLYAGDGAIAASVGVSGRVQLSFALQHCTFDDYKIISQC